MAKTNRNVGIGLVGMGFMGLTHLRAARKLKGGRIVAIATSDPRKATGDFSRVKGNLGTAGAQENLGAIRVYPHLDDVLADTNVRLVDICLPSYLHAEAAVRAMKAGKNVLVEKPLALTISDARRMLATSRRTGRLLMVAQVLKFFPEFAGLLQRIEQERYGKILGLHCRRIISKPDWSDESWFADPQLSGGMIVDLHIHDTDFTVHLFGKPHAVTARGVSRNGQIDYIRTVYDYGADQPLLSSEAGWINAQSLAFEHSYEVFFERATIFFNSTHCPRPTVYGPRSATNLPLPKGDPFRKEIQAAVDSIRKRRVHPLLAAESATTSLAVCLAEQKSALTKKRVAIR